MKIEVIYIPCYKLDYRLTRICVASIRHWYPSIPIVLLKDLILGDFDSSELEKYFNVQIFPQNIRAYGWGFSKLEAILQIEKKRFLMLDSDIVLVGPILEELEKYEEDWIVVEENYTEKDILKYYFDPNKLRQLDPDFVFPGFTFNSGQIVGTSGTLKRADFSKFLEWKEPRVQLFREAFTFGGEQPLLNYMLMKKTQNGEISLKRLDFMKEGLNPTTAQVSIERLKNKEGYPFVIHWHDKKTNSMDPKMEEIPRNDILLFYEDKYYSGANIGSLLKFLRRHYERLLAIIFMKKMKIRNRSKNQ